MFGIGSTELLVILVVALIVLGPKSLASVSRSLGKAMAEFRRVSTDFQRALNVEAAQAEAENSRPKTHSDRKRPEPAPKPDPDASNEPPAPPPDSPLAQAIAKAKAEAEKSGASGQDSSHGA